MKAEQLQLIAETAERYADYVVQGCEEIYAARTAAFAELAAMRTPITPDTLEADGWKQVSAPVPGSWFDHPEYIVSVCVLDGDVSATFYSGVVRGVKSMHDLHEMVRIHCGGVA